MPFFVINNKYEDGSNSFTGIAFTMVSSRSIVMMFVTCCPDRDETIVKAIPVKEFDPSSYLLFMTKNGMVKRTEMTHYKAQRYSKALVALNLKGDDELIDVHHKPYPRRVAINSWLPPPVT